VKHPIKTLSPSGVRRPSSANVGGDPRLERAIRFFDQRFAERVTIPAAARVAGLSPDHFVEVFRSALGCTPHQYLVRCRLRHARQLIASEGHRRSLAEIAWVARVRRPSAPDAPFSARLRAEPRPVAATNLVQNGPQLSRFCSRRMANGQTRLTL
jgi:transcriptional regulator GlxA family with amidase domain